MKDGLREVFGRRIARVVVGHNPNASPHDQVFLIFEDGASFEFYGENFSCAAGLDHGLDVEAYIRKGGGKVTAVYQPPIRTGPETAPYLVGLDGGKK